MRRIAAVVAASAAVMTLTGCDVTGTVDITLDTVTIDIGVRQEASDGFGACTLVPPDPVTRRSERLGDGVLGCRYTGTMSFDEARSGSVTVSLANDTLSFVSLPQWWYWSGGSSVQEGKLDLIVTLPGDVVLATANGVIDGGRVRFTDTGAALREGISVSVRPYGPDRSAWAWALYGLTAGLIVTVGGAWLWLRLRRAITDLGASRQAPPASDDGRRQTSPELPADQAAAPGVMTTPDPEPPDDPSVWAPEA